MSSEQALRKVFGREYSNQDLREAQNSSMSDLRMSREREFVYREAKQIFTNALTEVQRDQIFKQAKESILRGVISEFHQEMA